jgi:uncharacterized damage-inducible protein DinB
MAAEGLPLISFYSGWENYQDLLVTAIAPLTDEQLELRAAPSLRPVWLLAAHIISARTYWFHATLGEGEGPLEDYQDYRRWDDPGQPERSAAELELGLERTWELISGCLKRWTAADLDATFTTPKGRTVSRGWVIWHVLEHDLHHGGELSLTLGMHGLAAPDI